MRYFQCDYAEGCCPEILAALAETNPQQTVGYGEDEYCGEAARLIAELCGAPQAAVHFLVGGTQANLTVIDSILRSHQGVVSAEGGHIAVHETGAIEACGHKVLALPSPDGKISAAQIRSLCRSHYADESFEHTVQPGMVYLSFSTESGLLYSKAELEDIAAACKEYHLPLYIDGARLGYGLASPKNDCTLQDIARLADVFYIGGTKQGALFGEAVVITNPSLQKDFRYLIKQKGGMLAKGRLLGIQFKTLFTDNLYFRLAKKTVEQALRIRDAFQKRGVTLHFDSYTNQQFPILTQNQREHFAANYKTTFWQQLEDGRAVVRFCTSWATTDEAVDELVADIERMNIQ